MIIHPQQIQGAILAGGRHRRMGSTPKWQLPIAGKSIITHILERFRPQVATVVINGSHPELKHFGCRTISDVVDKPPTTPQGPMAGLLASLLDAKEHGFHWVATCPCDAPRIPTDYICQLSASINTHQLCAIITVNGKIQPVFGLWSTALIPHLQNTLSQSHTRAIGLWIKQLKQTAQLVEYNTNTSIDKHAFMNINTPEELSAAQTLFNEI